MQNLPVNWYEGLFLRPQHFQATERHLGEVLTKSSRFDNAYNYGIANIQFNKESLANHRFELLALQARMRDGTIIDFDQSQQPDGVDMSSPETGHAELTSDLKKGLEAERTVTVYLGVPKLKLGRVNVGEEQGADDTRFVTTVSAKQDEGDGQSNQDIQFRQLNAKIVLSTENLSGLELLPLGRVSRVSESESLPRLDETFIPPLLSIDSWHGLSIDIFRSIYDVVGQKIETLSQQMINRGVGLESREPGDAARVLMLNELNSVYARLSIMAFARGIHPLHAYMELCEVVGKLSIFSEARRVMELLPYDHDDLYRIFSDIRLKIEGLLNSVANYEYEQRFFVGVGMGMQVTLEPKWFNSNWQWYIGVKQTELSEQECRDLLSAGQLDWKLGSARQVEFLFKQRASGLQIVHVNRAIGALPHRHEWLYYEVPRQESPAWKDVQATQTLAMRLKDSLILNSERLQGEQTLIVSAFGRKVPLQIALFAIPDQT
ncbi:type VI secretion system baseplate subunit TssK [Pirellulaceae bacterium]|jgi:type VI secretion system protein ImpJ|nr:type VI secretion system baseplate subunit TssK [Pirellulaceae bacterium]